MSSAFYYLHTSSHIRQNQWIGTLKYYLIKRINIVNAINAYMSYIPTST